MMTNIYRGFWKMACPALSLLSLLTGCGKIDQTMQILEENKQAVQMSTWAIQENIRAVEEANREIEANIRAIQEANRGIEENRRQLDEINKTLQKVHEASAS